MPPLTERSAVDLAGAVRRRELTSVEVVEAHLELLGRADPRINAIAADCAAGARQRSREIDQQVAGAALRGNGAVDVQPLAGVPFAFAVPVGSADVANFAAGDNDHPALRRVTAMKRVVEAGAVPVAVTDGPRRARSDSTGKRQPRAAGNPYDPSRSAGGALGGAAAMVGCGGVPFAIAADGGGALRASAMLCGVFAHKPSLGLVPSTGLAMADGGDSDAMFGFSVLTRRAEDLLPIVQVMSGPDGWDPTTTRTQLGDPSSVSLDGLLVTVIEDAPVWQAARAVRDARERAVGALVAAGARIRSLALLDWRVASLSLLEVHWRLRRPTRISALAKRVATEAGATERLVANSRAVADALVEAIGDGVLLHPAYMGLPPRRNRFGGLLRMGAAGPFLNRAGVPVTEVPLGLSAAGLPVGIQVASARGTDHLSIAVALELEAVFGGWTPPPAP